MGCISRLTSSFAACRLSRCPSCRLERKIILRDVNVAAKRRSRKAAAPEEPAAPEPAAVALEESLAPPEPGQIDLSTQEYMSFPMDKCEFLVSQTPDGRLNLNDIYMRDEEADIFARPDIEGEVNNEPALFHAVPWQSYTSGDEMKRKPRVVKTLKMILVRIAESTQPMSFEEFAKLYAEAQQEAEKQMAAQNQTPATEPSASQNQPEPSTTEPPPPAAPKKRGRRSKKAEQAAETTATPAADVSMTSPSPSTLAADLASSEPQTSNLATPVYSSAQDVSWRENTWEEDIRKLQQYMEMPQLRLDFNEVYILDGEQRRIQRANVEFMGDNIEDPVLRITRDGRVTVEEAAMLPNAEEVVVMHEAKQHGFDKEEGVIDVVAKDGEVTLSRQMPADAEEPDIEVPEELDDLDDTPDIPAVDLA